MVTDWSVRISAHLASFAEVPLHPETFTPEYTMANPDLKPLFAAIDAKDSDAFVSFFTEDGVFRFGNAEPVVGRDNVHAAVTGFFGSIKGLSHSVADLKDTGDVMVSHGHVTYTRHNDTTLSVPFCNVFNMKEGKIQDYLIFVDASQLYA
jgi:hypothetical protein